MSGPLWRSPWRRRHCGPYRSTSGSSSPSFSSTQPQERSMICALGQISFGRKNLMWWRDQDYIHMEEANGFSGQEADKVKLRGQRVSGRKFRLKALCMSSYLDTCRKGEDLIHASLCSNLYMTEGQLNNNNMVTSKRQKTYLKTQLAGHVSPSVFGKCI